MSTKTWLKRHAKEIGIDAAIAFFVVGLIGMGGLLIWISTLEIPDLSAFTERRIEQSTKIYDRTGEVLLYDLHQDVKRTIVPFENISHHIKNATVAIEDDEFYNHFGIDPFAILRAAIANFTQGDLLGGQGGSTITQQVIKNSILEQEKKLTRKVKEAILAIKLERTLTKEEILSHYLNESPYGGTIYGVEEASQTFFGKAAKDVTLPEAAYLAALPQAPTYLSPFGKNKDALDARQKLVLERMRVNGFINEDEYNEAIATTVTFNEQAITGIRAPHFVMYIRDLLVEKYGEEALMGKGLKVTTTLDWKLQEEAEKLVKEYAFINEKKFGASNAGLVAIDPKTGDVLVMVGSRDYFDTVIEGNFNTTIAPRQPGSSIKPMVYASAFARGYTPETKVFDLKTQFSTVCEPWDTSNEAPCYSPNNYNNKFVGPISLRNALAQSLNIPAVKVLYLTGIRDAIKTTQDMGITTLNDPDRLGLTLVLGGGEVKLLEHTGAYSVFANEGVRADQRSILKIEDSLGNLIEEIKVTEARVLDRNVTLQISDILSDNDARTPLWGANSLIRFTDRDVAAKSGSTNNSRDAWIMGYAPNLTVGVWVGNNDNKPMNGLSGLIATPLWRKFFDFALKDLPVERFAEPATVQEDLKPVLRGQLFDIGSLMASVPEGQTLDVAGLTGGMHNILHYVEKRNPKGPYPVNPASDSQYRNWEYPVQNWVQGIYGALVGTTTSTTPPQEGEASQNNSSSEEDPVIRPGNRRR
jgi:penicillin-binding protein 1C